MSNRRRQSTVLPRNRALVRSSRRRPGIPLGHIDPDVPEIYRNEIGHRYGSKFKWLVSTCVAAVVAVISIGVVLVAFMDGEKVGDFRAAIERGLDEALSPVAGPIVKAGSDTGSRKTDRLTISAAGLATRHIIQDSVRQRLGERELITIKPYGRIVARLGTTMPEEADKIPPFNPFALYSNTSGKSSGKGAGSHGSGRVEMSVVDPDLDDLIGGDGQELSDQEAAAIVAEAAEELRQGNAVADTFADSETMTADGGTALESTAQTAVDDATVLAEGAAETAELLPPDTVVIEKSSDEADLASLEGQEVRVLAVAKGDTIWNILTSAQAESWQTREIVDAVRKALGSDTLQPGQTIRLTTAPSPTGDGSNVPVVFSLFSEGHEHLVTVARNTAGEYVATDQLLAGDIGLATLGDSDAQPATLYTSLYSAALQQGLPEEMIQTILRVHAVDTDFKRRVGPNDGFEVFFDVEGDTSSPDAKPDHLLFTALTVGGETRKFYRFRTGDGLVDYYDEHGNNARKFLLLKPVRSSDVRFVSGFGMRSHPLLKIRKMHTGVDWATKPGTPIVAAGNGVVEEIGRKGAYGNYIRIRHANGYQTTYAHQSGFAAGLKEGSKVTQGQVIGYVGSTGLSSGPHLHFEVLINDNFVDPTTLSVPRERQLTGKLLADFQKEKERIDELMHRPPVSTLVAEARSDG